MENQKRTSYFAVQIVLITASCAAFGAAIVHFFG